MATNPFRAAREQHGMTATAWALTLGVSAATVEAAEEGAIAWPRKLALSLATTTGADPAALLEEYAAWRNERRSSFRARLVTK